MQPQDVVLPENKTLPTHLFQFKDCEINFDKNSIDIIMTQLEK